MIYNQCLLLRNGRTVVLVESRCLDRVMGENKIDYVDHIESH